MARPDTGRPPMLQPVRHVLFPRPVVGRHVGAVLGDSRTGLRLGTERDREPHHRWRVIVVNDGRQELLTIISDQLCMELFRTDDLSGKLLHGTGWFGSEVYNGTAVTWMQDRATMTYYNPDDSSDMVKLKLGGGSFGSPRTLRLKLNGEPVSSYGMSDTWLSEVTTPFLEMLPGENVLEFSSLEGCDMSGEGDSARPEAGRACPH